MSMPKSIAIGLVKAQAYARGVQKLGRNKQGSGYDYATAEDVIAEGRVALLEGGRLAFAVTGWTFEAPAVEREAKTRQRDDGKTQVLAQAIGRIRVKYVLTHVDDGESFEAETSAPVVPEFGRPDDKAEYGALTECHAYTLRGLLNLPRGVEGAVNMNQRPDEATIAGSDATPAEQTPPPPARAAAPVSQVRAAADAAAAAQVRGPMGQAAPSIDPAHEALCTDFERRSRAAGDLAALFEECLAAKMPKALRDRAAVAILEAVFAETPAEHLDGWVEALRALQLPDPSALRDRMNVALEAAYARIDGQQAA